MNSLVGVFNYLLETLYFGVICRIRYVSNNFLFFRNGGVTDDLSTQRICRIGTVNLSFTSGKIITLVDVLFVRLRKNLVSRGCLNSTGFK